MAGANGSGGVHVEHESLRTQATKLAETKNEIEQVLARCQAQIQELITSGFVTDSASASFGDAHDRWNTAAKNCIAELDTMGTYLGKASEAFASVDSQFTVKL
ncbi:WXG100 family type VII secretion target [Angustibacter aerolatus]